MGKACRSAVPDSIEVTGFPGYGDQTDRGRTPLSLPAFAAFTAVGARQRQGPSDRARIGCAVNTVNSSVRPCRSMSGTACDVV